MNNVIDHGEHDPLPFELGSWNPVAEQIRQFFKAKREDEAFALAEQRMKATTGARHDR